MTVPKTLKYFVVGLLIVATVGFILFEYVCRSKMAKYSAFSINRETAISEGFYIDTYVPVQTSLVMSNNADTIKFDSAWSEHSWTTERRFGLCLCEHKIKGDSYNFCIPFSTTSSDINSYKFDMKQLHLATEPYYDPGSYLGNRFNFGLSALSDTIKIILTQTNVDINTTIPFVDTLLFIKTKNSR
jgi:hypothetical protein